MHLNHTSTVYVDLLDFDIYTFLYGIFVFKKCFIKHMQHKRHLYSDPARQYHQKHSQT